MNLSKTMYSILSLFSALSVSLLATGVANAEPPGGYFRLQTMLQERNNRCLESNRVSPGAALGGASYMDMCQNVSGQLWKATPDGQGYYWLKSMFLEGENKCLEGSRPFATNDPLNGAARMDPCGNFSGQKWRFISKGNGYYQLTNAFLEGANLCLESSGPDAPNDPLGGAARMDPCGNFTGQLWKLMSWAPAARVGSNPNLQPGAYSSFRSFNYPDRYLRHRNFAAELTAISPASQLERHDATFRISSGLAGGNSISLESSNYPGHFLRHQSLQLKLHPFANDDLYRRDSSFHVRPGLANGSLVSFESVNYPGYYLRHRSFQFFLEQGDDELFRNDATFIPELGLSRR